MSFSLTPSMAIAGRMPSISSAFVAVDGFIRWLQDMRAKNNGGFAAMSDTTYATRFRLWQPPNWLYQLEQFIPASSKPDLGGDVNDWMFLSTSNDRKYMKMPSSCGYLSYLKNGRCDMKIDMKEWMGASTPGDLHLSLATCKSKPGGLPSFTIAMKSDTFASMMSPIKSCSTASDCGTGFECKDRVWAQHGQTNDQFIAAKKSMTRRRRASYSETHKCTKTNLPLAEKNACEMEKSVMDGKLMGFEAVTTSTLVASDDWVGRYAFGCAAPAFSMASGAKIQQDSTRFMQFITGGKRDATATTKFCYPQQSAARFNTAGWEKVWKTETSGTTVTMVNMASTAVKADYIPAKPTEPVGSLVVYVAAGIKLSGVTKAAFTPAVQETFKQTVAIGLGVSPSEVEIVSIDATTRRSGIDVKYRVKVATVRAAPGQTEAKQTEATKKKQADTMKAMSAFMAGTGDFAGKKSFLETFKETAKASGNTEVTKVATGVKTVTVTKAPAAQQNTVKAPSPSESSSSNTGMIIGVIVGVVVVLALTGVGVWYFFIRRPASPADQKVTTDVAMKGSDSPPAMGPSGKDVTVGPDRL
jgi:hypothetical protein